MNAAGTAANITPSMITQIKVLFATSLAGVGITTVSLDEIIVLVEDLAMSRRRRLQGGVTITVSMPLPVGADTSAAEEVFADEDAQAVIIDSMASAVGITVTGISVVDDGNEEDGRGSTPIVEGEEEEKGASMLMITVAA